MPVTYPKQGAVNCKILVKSYLVKKQNYERYRILKNNS